MATRPLARLLARELTEAECTRVAGADTADMMMDHMTDTGRITHRNMDPPDDEYVRDPG